MRRMLLRLARSRVGGWLVHLGVAYMHIPPHRLYETSTLAAFYHPQPSYRVHVLIVPKRYVLDMASLTAVDAAFLQDLYEAVPILVKRLQLDGYRLVCNGGRYQEVPHLHFHLIAE